jgi:hypothetical protein
MGMDYKYIYSWTDEWDIRMAGRIEANRKKGNQVKHIFASFERKGFCNS